MFIEPLNEKGVHEVFDNDLDSSYKIKDVDNSVLGYVSFTDIGNNTIWIEYILAENRGLGNGKQIVETLFNLGYDCIEGSSIFGPHYFWLSIGATFELEPDEDDGDGLPFVLTKESFIN